MTCELCDRPRKPRYGKSKGFYHLCETYMKEKLRESYQRHKEDRLTVIAKYYISNKEQRVKYAQEYTPKWREKNPAKVKKSAWKARQIRREVKGFFTDEQWQARVAFYGGLCYLCGCDWEALPSFEKTIDHVIPLSKEGTNWPSNLRPACRKCNSSKRDRFKIRKRHKVTPEPEEIHGLETSPTLETEPELETKG